MKHFKRICIGLFLVIVVVIGIAAAESETTYYILDGNGEWRVCTDSETAFAQYYLNKFTELFPDKTEDRTWGPGLDDYDNIVIPTPTPKPTPTPTVKPTHVPVRYSDDFLKDVISNGLPKRTVPKVTFQFR